MYEDERPRTGAAQPLDAAPSTFDRVNRSGAPVSAPAEPVVATPTIPATRAESVVDAHSNFDGRFETEQDLRIEGTISGDVVCKGRFTVEREATAKTKLQAHEAHIKGRFEGEISCSGLLVIASTAVVSGTIKAATLVVEEGASLSGAVETAKSASSATRPTSIIRDKERASASESIAVEQLNPPARTSRGREVPSFALVSSENPDRN